MDLQGQKVIHKTFGTGTVTNQDGQYFIVHFDSGAKKFSYPDAFKQFLTPEDADLAKAIQKELEEIARNNTLPEREPVKRPYYPPPSPPVKSHVPAKRAKTKSYPRYSVAFKCNYCDGGQSPSQIGFDGVCSDPVIHNNIYIEKRAWCSSQEAPCRHYFDGEIRRRELEEQARGSQFVCYESQMLRDWRAYAWFVLTGKNKGRPLKLKHVQPYSLCVLTTRDPGSENESYRYIFAVFLVDDTYTGDSRDEGYVTTSSKYKVKLSPQEAHSMLFWKYHANGNNPQEAAWASGLFRYFDEKEGTLILRDIAAIKHGTQDEDMAEEFYQYFCRINAIDPEQLGEPTGALSIKEAN